MSVAANWLAARWLATRALPFGVLIVELALVVMMMADRSPRLDRVLGLPGACDELEELVDEPFGSPLSLRARLVLLIVVAVLMVVLLMASGR